MDKDEGRVGDAEQALSATPTEPVPVSALPGDDPSRAICGWATMTDGSHVPITRDFADALWAGAKAEKAKRATDMPTEQDAINAMNAAWQRLKELDWNDPIYCPKDGSSFDVVEAGSTGIHRAHYSGEWPNGSWLVEDGGDLWPSRPTLYRRTEAEKAKWAEIGKRFRDNGGLEGLRDTAQAMSAGTAETLQAAQGEARQRGGNAMRPTDRSHPLSGEQQ